MKKKVLLYNSINKPFMKAPIDPFNLGLLALSSCLKRAGYRPVLIPNIDSPGTKELIEKEIKSSVLVGVSCMTGDPINNGLKFCEYIKSLDKKMPICWGGFHATIDFKNTIKNKLIDFVIRGQGEEAVVELVEALTNDFGFVKIKGLVYKDKGKIKINEIRPNEAIDKFPFFDYDLYVKRFGKKAMEMVIYCSSRGCPFECTFCSVANLYHRKYFYYSGRRMMSDIGKIVRRYNPKMIFFWDDNFFVDMKRVELFLKEYKKKNYKFEWMAFSRCGTFARENKTLLKDLKRTRCKKIFFGAESGSERILSYIKKHIRTEDIVDSCKVMTKYKIDPDYTFMSGFPTETLDDLRMTLDLIKKLNQINSRAGLRLFSFNPTPGIPILADCRKNGFRDPEKMEEWSKYEYHSFVAPWIGKRHQSLLKVVVWITSFLTRNTLPLTNKRWFNAILWLLHYDARLRVRFNFYHLAWEWRSLYEIYRRHYQAG